MFYCNSSDILFLDLYIHRGMENSIIGVFKLTFYWKKSYYWYLAITYRRNFNNI